MHPRYAARPPGNWGGSVKRLYKLLSIPLNNYNLNIGVFWDKMVIMEPKLEYYIDRMGGSKALRIYLSKVTPEKITGARVNNWVITNRIPFGFKTHIVMLIEKYPNDGHLFSPLLDFIGPKRQKPKVFEKPSDHYPEMTLYYLFRDTFVSFVKMRDAINSFPYIGGHKPPGRIHTRNIYEWLKQGYVPAQWRYFVMHPIAKSDRCLKSMREIGEILRGPKQPSGLTREQESLI